MDAFWGNVLLHGSLALDLAKRPDYDRAPADDVPADEVDDDSGGDELVSASSQS